MILTMSSITILVTGLQHYDCWNEDNGFFRGFPKGDIYSFYKGNTFPDDMELHKMRNDQKICLFNNSTYTEGEYVEDIKEKW